MLEKINTIIGNCQQPVNGEGKAQAPAAPSDVATPIAAMLAEFQAQLARLDKHHQETKARLLP